MSIKLKIVIFHFYLLKILKQSYFKNYFQFWKLYFQIYEFTKVFFLKKTSLAQI